VAVSAGYWCGSPISAAPSEPSAWRRLSSARDDRAGGHADRPTHDACHTTANDGVAERVLLDRWIDLFEALTLCEPRRRLPVSLVVVRAPFRRLFSCLEGVQRGPCVWVDSGIFISPSPSGRPALAPACARIRPAFPLVGDQRNYLSRTNRALHQAPACRYCNL
jgi:hypothetical protein